VTGDESFRLSATRAAAHRQQSPRRRIRDGRARVARGAGAQLARAVQSSISGAAAVTLPRPRAPMVPMSPEDRVVVLERRTRELETALTAARSAADAAERRAVRAEESLRHSW